MRRADNLTTFIVFKSGSLDLLELSGPVQACNGIALCDIEAYVMWGRGFGPGSSRGQIAVNG